MVIGVNERGKKHLLAIEDGVRESTQSWREVLLKLKSRGMNVPELAIGDGAMGFWAALEEVYGRPLTGHVANFFQAVVDRRPPVSDPCSHHRALSTCHLAGIAARLGRNIQWDAANERIVDDEQARRTYLGADFRL